MLLLAALGLSLAAGLGHASPTVRGPTLSYEVGLNVTDYDIFEGPLGGGICLGGRRITDPKDGPRHRVVARRSAACVLPCDGNDDGGRVRG